MNTADVVIVGGGILGAAAAYELSVEGLDVAVLERGAPNREGSGSTAGNLHIQAIHTRRPGQAVPVDNVRFLPLQRAASELWSSVEAELGEDIELRRHGGFMVAESDLEQRELEEKGKHERAAGVPTEIIDGDTARQAVPVLGPTVQAATWCPLDGYANPLLVVPAWLHAASRKGATVAPFTPVSGIQPRGSGWELETPSGSWSTGAVLNLTGPLLSEVCALAGIRLRMAPLAIQMHVTDRLPPTMRHLVQHIAQGLSVKQVTSGQILIGGGWPARAYKPDARSPASVASLVGNIREAVRLLPFLRELRLLRMWAGPLAATPDEMPVIGEVPEHPGFFLAGGTYAFTFAPLWAKVLTDIITGRPPRIEVADLGVERIYGGRIKGCAPDLGASEPGTGMIAAKGLNWGRCTVVAHTQLEGCDVTPSRRPNRKRSLGSSQLPLEVRARISPRQPVPFTHR